MSTHQDVILEKLSRIEEVLITGYQGDPSLVQKVNLQSQLNAVQEEKINTIKSDLADLKSIVDTIKKTALVFAISFTGYLITNFVTPKLTAEPIAPKHPSVKSYVGYPSSR